jgi:2-keto-4-pentenoate hydratase/2-oxohepta-3-ene-1,7-dioic acid hydratase in catechol pathway
VQTSGIDGAALAHRAAPREVKMSSARLPINVPLKIICVGLNYHDHALEAGMAPPSAPLLFSKWHNTLIGPGEAIVAHSVTKQLDWEGELGVIVGRRLRRASPDEALDAVAGYLCVNDITARDLQAADGQWVRSKSLDTFCPIGPELVPATAIPNPQDLRIVTRVNGEIVQDGSTSAMIFGVAEVLSYVSTAITLEPGDLIATGTPAGVGWAQSPQRFLAPGDEVSVEIDAIGLLTNRVVSEAAV